MTSLEKRHLVDAYDGVEAAIGAVNTAEQSGHLIRHLSESAFDHMRGAREILGYSRQAICEATLAEIRRQADEAIGLADETPSTEE